MSAEGYVTYHGGMKKEEHEGNESTKWTKNVMNILSYHILSYIEFYFIDVLSWKQ